MWSNWRTLWDLTVSTWPGIPSVALMRSLSPHICLTGSLRGVLASPSGPLNELRFSETIQQEDLLTLIALSQSPDELRALFDTDADNAKADPAVFVRAKAEHDPFDADTFLADPAQRLMFERAFAEGASQGGEGRYEAWMAAAHMGLGIRPR